MPDGFLNLLKPPGMSSFLAVHLVRKLLPKGTKVGHMGTLDPAAAGVLPLGVGSATRLFDYVADKQKLYRAELCLGAATDTQDATGCVLAQAPPPSLAAVEAALPAFQGCIWQSPPAYSAVHVDGKRAYELARAGKAPETLPKRQVQVDSIRLLGPSGENRCLLDIACGKGVYVRTLLDEIAKAAGGFGHMSLLVRLRSGVFSIENAVTPEELRRQVASGEWPLLPMDLPIAHLPKVELPDSLRNQVKNGAPLRVGREACAQGPLRVYVGGRFAGIAQERGGMLRFAAMLLKDDPDRQAP